MSSQDISTNRFLFVADESGSSGMDEANSAWAFGGYVIKENNIPDAHKLWNSIRTNLSIPSNAELKWSNFFGEPNNLKNPLLNKTEEERIQLANELLRDLFSTKILLPLIIWVKKANVTSPEIFETAKRGGIKVNEDIIWSTPLGLFGKYMEEHNATGAIYCDEIGGVTAQKQRQRGWSALRRMSNEEPNKSAAPQVAKYLRNIDSKIHFINSTKNDLIQIADCVVGVIYSAARYDEQFLATAYEYYGPKATQNGLGLIQIT